MSYEPITFEEAEKNGKKAKAEINGKEYTGHIYEGYFFHKYDSINDIGNCKILLRYCENVRKYELEI